MAGEKEERLFEEIDFSGFIDELSLPGVTEVTPKEEETKEENKLPVITPQEDEIESKEDAGAGSKEVETEETTEKTEEIEDNSSPLTPYAKLLVDEGILPNFNLKEFDGTADGLKGAMMKEIEFGVNEYKQSLPEEVKKIIDNYEEGVPLSALLELDDRRVQYKSITEEDLKDKEIQKALLRDLYHQTTQFSDERIEKLIKRSEDLEELEEEAKNSLPELIKFQDVLEQQEVAKAKAAREAEETNRKEALETFKKTLEKTEEVIPGIKVNKIIKDTIYKSMTTPVGQDQYGNPLNKVAAYRIQHPYEFDIMLSYLYETTKGFKDWTMLSAAGKTKAIESFEKTIAKQEKSGSGKLPPTSKNVSTKGILDELANMKF